MPLSFRFNSSPIYFGFTAIFLISFSFLLSPFSFSPKLLNFFLSRSFLCSKPSSFPQSSLFSLMTRSCLLYSFLFFSFSHGSCSVKSPPGCWAKIRTRTCLATGRRANNYATPASNNPLLSSLLSAPASHFSKFVKQIRMLGQVRQPLPLTPLTPHPLPPPPPSPHGINAWLPTILTH